MRSDAIIEAARMKYEKMKRENLKKDKDVKAKEIGGARKLEQGISIMLDVSLYSLIAWETNNG